MRDEHRLVAIRKPIGFPSIASNPFSLDVLMPLDAVNKCIGSPKSRSAARKSGRPGGERDGQRSGVVHVLACRTPTRGGRSEGGGSVFFVRQVQVDSRIERRRRHQNDQAAGDNSTNRLSRLDCPSSAQNKTNAQAGPQESAIDRPSARPNNRWVAGRVEWKKSRRIDRFHLQCDKRKR